MEYEETGWYDGQVYVKDPEMLARDRLLGTYTVRPIVERLRKTLLVGEEGSRMGKGGGQMGKGGRLLTSLP